MSTSSSQFSLFKDRIASRILAHPAPQTQDATELDDFSTYLATESWSLLPSYIHDASYELRSSILTDINDISLDTTPISFVDTLISYGFASDHEEALSFLRKTLDEYLEDACAAPPVWSKTRTKECEICQREIPLTYHHLIPRSTHAKVIRKKWHPEAMLNSVAWLCRACHSVVHRVATNEELAREFYTVEALLKREDVFKWKNYAAKQRFGFKWRQSL